MGDYTLSVMCISYQKLMSNLVSIGQLVQKECEILIKKRVCKLYHPELGLIMQSDLTKNKFFKIVATRNDANTESECH